MKKVLYVLVIIVSLYIVNNLVRSIYGLWQKQDLMTSAREDLQKEQNEQEKLKDELTRVKRIDFVEQEARNKLFMGRPGEQVVLIDKSQTLQKKPVFVEEKENWRQWLDFFSGKK